MSFLVTVAVEPVVTVVMAVEFVVTVAVGSGVCSNSGQHSTIWTTVVTNFHTGMALF